MGHIAVAEFLGYETTLHYGSMNYDNSEISSLLDSIYIENQYAIENDLDFEERTVFERDMEKFYADDFLVLMGGPVQTILTGMLGLIILIFRRHRIRRSGLKIADWLAVFLSLFWLREVFNLLHSILLGFIYREEGYFGGDERYISEFLDLHPGVVPVILGFIGLGLSMYVIFKIIPRRFQLIFILSGIIGGVGGFLLWFEVLGPVLIP
ncbi:hypothetical protein NE848_04530 [Gramella jeungdoensis]|uniref:Uncharacterized protein n=1 Tax=Gramella jeungdoensis TaxID=708091 RepID=A0ABT0Z0E6_9FLAO|nr:hypothetical protein [Gramella jeungdoensis]MCM8568632.1 hypothetical protein [Gramella jeungdoensis]